LSWIADGSPANDTRKNEWVKRNDAYKLVFSILDAVETVTRNEPAMIDGVYTRSARLSNEAYELVYSSKDEVFQNSLYDWYMSKSDFDRLLSVDNDFVVSYLQRKAGENFNHAELLITYYVKRERFFEAATEMYQLSANQKSSLPLEDRIRYLSQARGYASTYTPSHARQQAQTLLHSITTMLEVANLQLEVLQRLTADTRLLNGKREYVQKSLGGHVIDISEVSASYIGFEQVTVFSFDPFELP
jgi:nuclear pore complex protein Nup155